ncbi:MAG TPA: MGMT family protein [Candidatus Nanoarchaeia archaeon]|nr:MGMT family protein [Candidatus Nanoarchaeia archaeon]
MKFADKVYGLCKKIPKGKVSTYGAIAKALNSSPRAVGQALRCNPYAPIVPCHRVVASGGKIGGFMGKTAGKEIQKKIELLKKEGVETRNGNIIDFEKLLLKLD